MTLATQLLPWKSWSKTAIPSGAPVITPQEREAKRKAKAYFNSILQLGRNQLNWAEEEMKKAEAMLTLLGENYPISENHTTSSIFYQMRKAQPKTTYIQKPTSSQNTSVTNKTQTPPKAPHKESIFEKFQKAYKDPEKAAKALEYQKLFQLVDSEKSEASKRLDLYCAFRQDPVAILVCISHPISQSKNTLFRAQGPYRLMEYIFQDAEAWKKIASHVLSHRENIGLFNVEKLFLPILQKALSLDFSAPSQQPLVAEERNREEQAIDVPRYENETEEQKTKRLQQKAHRFFLSILMDSGSSFANRELLEVGIDDSESFHKLPNIVTELLTKKELIDNHTLGDSVGHYIPGLHFNLIDMENALKRDSMGFSSNNKENMLLDIEENHRSHRNQLLESGLKSIKKQADLLDKQKALLEKEPWLMNSQTNCPLLDPKKALDLLKQIIEISPECDIPYDSAWYLASIPFIHRRCVELLLAIPNREKILECISKAKDTFVHSAASRGREPKRIIQAIAKEPALHFMLQKCCHHISENVYPLEIALKTQNEWSLIQILIEHTDDLIIWKRLLKTRYHSKIHTKDDVLKLIESDYQTVSNIAYRRLNTQYRNADQKIRDCIPHDGLYYGIQYNKLMAEIKTSSFTFQHVLADHLGYLEYLLKGSHTTLDETRGGYGAWSVRIDIYPDNFKKALFATISNKARLSEIQNSPDKYPTLYWWTTLLPQASQAMPTIGTTNPKSSNWNIGLFKPSRGDAQHNTSDNHALLAQSARSGKYPFNKSPITRLEPEVKKTILKLFKEWQEEKALESSTPRLAHQGP